MQELKKYRPIPFWSWNDRLEINKLKKEIKWMDENGIGGFFMHARSGIVTEYMSEEWMRCIEACVEQAERLDMKAWLYDENGWPSGFAGGKLLNNEENRDQYITYSIGEYEEDATICYLLTDKQICRVKSKSEGGEYLNLYIHVSVSTADILNPKVVEQFIEMTHEKYRVRFGKDFNKKIEGFFTDEPQYYRLKTPYTKMIRQYFKDEYNEEILDSLGLLFVEKEGYRKFRYRYWKGMQALMLRNFAEKIYNWCEANGVKLTGHYVQEDSMGLQNMCCGGVMPFYEFEHIPGIDWLGNVTYQMGELAAKQVGSVAVQLGKKRVLTESFGCCGWDVTPRELKKIAGFQYVNGVNMLCHHLIPYTERGNRKYDHPAHYSVDNPWVKECFNEFNDYFTQLGYMLGEGEQCVNVAVLHPIRSTYFDYKREAQGFGVKSQDEFLRETCRMLSSHNVEYHFLDEILLAKYGYVEGNEIGCGSCQYKYLILPNILTMDTSTEQLLHQYVDNGGKVLILGEMPSYLEGDEYVYDYLTNTCTFDEIVKKQLYQVKNTETMIYSTYRKLHEEEFLYVINVSDQDVYEQQYEFGKGIHSFEKLNILTGERECIPLSISLKPGEDAILYLSNRQAPDKEFIVPYELRFHDAVVHVPSNVLLVDQISYSFDGMDFSKKWPCVALFQKLLKERYCGKIFFKYEFTIREIPTNINLRAETDGRDVKAWVNGVHLREEKKCEENHIRLYDITSMVCEGENEYIVETDWYENEFTYYALFGENVTESLRNCVTYDSELQPIYLEGNFGVYSDDEYREDKDSRYIWGNHFWIGRKPERVSELVTGGFPFLAGKLSLEQSIQLDNPCVMIRLPGEYQMAELFVNHKPAGRLLYEKELDISKLTVVGENHILVHFWIGNQNMMGPHHFLGNRGDGVSPWTFELYHSWDEDKSPFYSEAYLLKKFY